jgi:hypothetical protein
MAFDVFYLTDPAGGQLPEDRWEEIRSQVESALQMPQANP